ncbi:RNA dependent RNA polymerase-domain-containing protein [Lentinula edodes]|nr:RNA dependent RNA polymerase-domain-containing protein [Lentinula edodes]
MEIHMKNIELSLTKYDVTRHLAHIFHGPGYLDPQEEPINFEVYLYDHNRLGRGALTLPNISIATQFLQEYGQQEDGLAPPKSCVVGQQRIRFAESYNEPRSDIIEKITRLPFQDPSVAEGEENRSFHLQSHNVSLKSIQFGWLARDGVVSIEWEHSCLDGHLSFSDKGPPEIRIRTTTPSNFAIIRIQLSLIRYLSVSDLSHIQGPILYLNLWHPPSFETRSRFVSPDAGPCNERVSFLPLPGHELAAPYVSEVIRLVCGSATDLPVFRRLFRLAQIRPMKTIIDRYEEMVERRGIFQPKAIELVENFVRILEWKVAFQVDYLIRRLQGPDYAVAVLRHFSTKVQRWTGEETDGNQYDSIEQCFILASKSYAKCVADGKTSNLSSLSTTDSNLFTSYHVVVTPSSYLPDGPFIERSNRVIRWFDSSQSELFLKVRFADEGSHKYRHDRNIDGKSYIRNRIGAVLSKGLTIAGREFKFLAYTQSSLKDHTAVWFFKPNSNIKFYDSFSIIQEIGSFEEPELRRCPALYGARISQAFTATEASFTKVEEVFPIEDKLTLDKAYNFTDGVGTTSKDFAEKVWNELKATKRRTRNGADPTIPCFQIRYGGSKGMLSIDYKLRGNVISVRPSMRKFDSILTHDIEVAQFFDRPLKLTLNRPLVMILEDLGVPYETFEDLQEEAIEHTRRATESLATAARLLENFGLGNSFRLTSILLGLSRLGVDNHIQAEPFHRSVLNYAVHHILRELKHHTRIPVEGAWNLVGVADEHGFLQEGEIFAAIKEPNGAIQYLEGECIVTRSPAIHPGDCQIAIAIGPPPSGSCFAREPLTNTVVFPTIGSRPMPSMLGGGDLDGDTYNVIPLNIHPQLRPTITVDPASYARPTRKLLDQDCTLNDVADFIVEYVNSDLVGLIATRWLIIADQNQRGVLHEDCLELARLHSNAVDYPKTGQPVYLKELPKVHFSQMPDWIAPETVPLNSTSYYQSKRAIGLLSRAVTLPPVKSTVPIPRPQKRRLRPGNPGKPSMVPALGTFVQNDDLYLLLKGILSHHGINVHGISQESEDEVLRIFQNFIFLFEGITTSYTLSSTTALAEEEVILGTIAAKTSHFKSRREKMARLRDHTQILVKDMRNQIAEEHDLKTVCERAWSTWVLSRKQAAQGKFGAWSFQYIVLGLLLDSIKDLTDDEDEDTRTRLKRKHSFEGVSEQKRSRYTTTQRDLSIELNMETEYTDHETNEEEDSEEGLEEDTYAKF